MQERDDIHALRPRRMGKPVTRGLCKKKGDCAIVAVAIRETRLSPPRRAGRGLHVRHAKNVSEVHQAGPRRSGWRPAESMEHELVRTLSRYRDFQLLPGWGLNLAGIGYGCMHRGKQDCCTSSVREYGSCPVHRTQG